MGTTAQKLQKILDTKAALKNSINAKGGTITDDTPFSEYSTQVDNISSTPVLENPNLTFAFNVDSNKNMYVRIDTYGSSINTKTIYIYKFIIEYVWDLTSSSATPIEKRADLYLSIGFDESTSIANISFIPFKNSESNGSITLTSTGSQLSFSNYAANFTFFFSSSNKGYAYSINLISNELINIIKDE